MQAAKSELIRLGVEKALDPAHIDTLAQAVDTFGLYIKPEPLTPEAYKAERGRCFTIPGYFAQFCGRLGVTVDIAYYHPKPLFHKVNVFSGIVIDWTAKQYVEDRDKSYPYVYAADNPGRRAAWGALLPS
jgi:hypothetical protein